MKSDQLDAAQKSLKVLKALSWVLIFAALAAFAGAIWLAPSGSRREALRVVACAFILVGILLLVIRRVAELYIVNALTSGGSLRNAADATWLIATSLLAQVAWSLILYGVVALIGVALAGPYNWARRFRLWLAPMLRDHAGTAWAILAGVFLLLVLWGPTPTFHTWLGVLILAVSSRSASRRSAASPSASSERRTLPRPFDCAILLVDSCAQRAGASERRTRSMFRRRRPLARAAIVGGTAYYAGKKVQGRTRARRVHGERLDDLEGQQAAPQAPPPPPAGGMTDEKIEQLKQLSELKDQGVLTEEKFAAPEGEDSGGIMSPSEGTAEQGLPFGPVQMLVLEFDSENLKGEILPEMRRLKEAGIVRLIDLLVVQKQEDGDIITIQDTDLSQEEAMSRAIAGALIGLGAAGEEGAEAGAVAGAEALADSMSSTRTRRSTSRTPSRPGEPPRWR